MLKLIDITKEYKVEEESVLALHNLSVEFRRNEFVSILGPSGCGKTTLLNIIGGLDRYTSGDIQVEGVSTEDYDDLDWDTYRNQRIGFVFQSYNLIPHISVLKNVALSLTLAGVGKEESRARALEALGKVGLEKQAKKKPNQLSGGQMQRVAIARAIVNNPEIILADEPTGALDSESGVRVMELLKEVARDRLVIMVTHNGQLAEEYSTRIINLKDGEIVGDTMPYNADDAAEEAAALRYRQVEEDAIAAEEEADDPYAKADKQRLAVRRGLFAATVKTESEKKNLWERIKARVRKRKIKEKSSMALSTAISLSWTNLLSKKGRTALTSFAGSIGIIGILLVLTLSNGVNAYIRTLEENALSQYPITIEENGFDVMSLMQTLTNMNPEGEEYPDDGLLTPSRVLGNLMDELGDIISGTKKPNDLAALKKWLDSNFDTELGTVKYDYATTLNVYADNPSDESEYMKVNPFMDAFSDFTDGNDFLAVLEQYGSALGSGWDEISDDKALLEQQYEVVGGRWPENANEIVIVMDKYNQVPDFALFILGLKSTSDIGSLINDDGTFYSSYSIDSLIGTTYKILADSDYYRYDAQKGGYVSGGRDLLSKEAIDKLKPIEVKVVGVIRPEQGVNVTSINGYVGYTHALTLELLDRVNYSAPVQAQYKAAMTAQGIEFDPNGVVDPEVINSLLNDAIESTLFSYPSAIEFDYIYKEGNETKTKHIAIGDAIGAAEHKYISSQGMLGVADEANPSAIRIFCRSFDSKEGVEALIARYSQESGNEIQYSDTLGMIMTFVEEMANTMANVLVGFAAISLIVSTIMIAIIIYTSVLERRKEIGVLRSLGARKKDIARVFTAESAIIGSFSGIIGVILSLVFAAIGNAVLALLVSIKGLMAPEWWHFVLMFFVSILLAVFAGFIPSHVAARKDPTVALRSE